MCIPEKLKMCRLPVKASAFVQKSEQNFLAKIMQSACFCFPKSYTFKNPMNGSRFKYRFR